MCVCVCLRVCVCQVGMYQTNPHEISGKQVVDANKYALQVLDRTACKHLGIQHQERPLIGVRGQRKDMGRGAFCLQNHIHAHTHTLSLSLFLSLTFFSFACVQASCCSFLRKIE